MHNPHEEADMFKELGRQRNEKAPGGPPPIQTQSNLFGKYSPYKPGSTANTPDPKRIKIDPIIMKQKREQGINDRLENQLEKIGPAAEGNAALEQEDENNSTVTQTSLIE